MVLLVGMRSDVRFELLLGDVFGIEGRAGRLLHRAGERLVLFQTIPRPLVGQEVFVGRPALFRQLGAPLRIALGDLAPVELIDGLRCLDQLGHDLLLVVVEQRAVVVDDGARKLGQALRRVGRHLELRRSGFTCGHDEKDCKRCALHGGGF